MPEVYLAHPGDSDNNRRMPRRKVFEKTIDLPITDAQLARIEACYKDTGEVRVSFIRTAIEELKRREGPAQAGAAIMTTRVELVPQMGPSYRGDAAVFEGLELACALAPCAVRLPGLCRPWARPVSSGAVALCVAGP